MSHSRLLEQDGNSEEEERRFSLREKELEVIMIPILDRRIRHVLEGTIVPMFSRIVNEAVELAAEKLWASMMHNSGSGLRSSGSRSLQLEFMDKLSLPVYTNRPIKGEGPTPLRVALVDGITKQIVSSGAEAFTKVEIVVVKGDLDSDQWTPEEFHKMIVREKEGKKSLLTGNVYLNLEEGIGYVRDISFTHNANWMKVCELRLAAKVVDNVNGMRVREAVTESFVIKDYRVTYNEKHYPPSLNDEIWRLTKIGKGGVFHHRLVAENVKTVKDFLTRFFMNPQSLQNILGKSKTWEAIVDHARTCILDKSLQLYFPINSERRSGVVFNVVGQVMGLIVECYYVPIDKLSEDQKVVANNLVVSALEHMEEVASFADETCLHSYLLSVNSAYPSNSPRLESPGHYNCEPSRTHYGHEHNQALLFFGSSGKEQPSTSVNCAYPSNSPRLESPGHYNCEPSHTHYGQDHTQPSTSSHNNEAVPFQLSNAGSLAKFLNNESLNIMSFDPSFGSVSHLNENGRQNIEEEEDLINYHGTSINHFTCDTEFPSPSLYESQHLHLLDTDPSFQYQTMNSEAQDDLSRIFDSFLASRAADVAKAQRKWSMLYSVLRSKRKLVSSAAVLASKRPKICQL